MLRMQVWTKNLGEKMSDFNLEINQTFFFILVSIVKHPYLNISTVNEKNMCLGDL